MGGKWKQKCLLDVKCPKYKDYICCVDCKYKANCKMACKNQPEKCGMVKSRKRKQNEKENRAGNTKNSGLLWSD